MGHARDDEVVDVDDTGDAVVTGLLVLGEPETSRRLTLEGSEVGWRGSSVAVISLTAALSGAGNGSASGGREGITAEPGPGLQVEEVELPRRVDRQRDPLAGGDAQPA